MSHTLRPNRTTGIAATAFASLLCLNGAQAGEAERIIFAAENALYAAGHDIGRADGWLDDQLRAAVRAYQQSRGLQANGTLNQPTIAALGVNAEVTAPIADNAASSRAQVARNLGLSSPEPRKTPPRPVVQTVAEAPKPIVTPIVVPVQSASEPAETVLPERTSETGSETEKPEIQFVEEPSSQTVEEKEGHREISKAINRDVAPASSPTEQSLQKVDAVLAQLPTEPTSAGEATQPVAEVEPQGADQSPGTAAPEQPPGNRERRSGGGFFSALFDFFFGWLV